MKFAFQDTSGLTDGEIYLRCEMKRKANRRKGRVPAYLFTIRKAGTGETVGNIDLRVGHSENTWFGGNIGYAVAPAHRGNRYAAKACRLCFELARRHGVEKLLITCNPENAASRRTCELVGGRLLCEVPIPEHNEMYREGERYKCIYEVAL